jgi:hypothetical protein
MNTWKLLRVLTGLGVDPDWPSLMLHPNTGVYTVGGTASNGVYSFTVGGTAIEFDRQDSESNAEIATELAALLEESPYVVSAVAISTAIRVRWKMLAETRGGRYANGQESFGVALAAPGSGTLTGLPATRWPIATVIRRAEATAIELAFIQVDDNGVPIPDDNVATVFPQIVESWVRDGVPRTIRSATGVSLSVRVKLIAPSNGAEIFTVRLGSPAVQQEATGYAALEVWYREATH